ncbi:MAG: hypothetical protein OK474_09165 [Thaumarchaeota archaeon]|nr:hypothetical protein [Nitrososphaerota archaeon]
MSAGFGERLYPIGALSEREVAEIRTDPLCADDVGIDALMSEWHAKSDIFRSLPREPLGVLDSDLLPLNLSAQIEEKVQTLLSSYRVYLPNTYDLALVPISRLVSPQKYIHQEHARSSFDGVSRMLTDDENARFCIGTPVRDAKIDAAFLGCPKGETAEEFNFLYQFSSDDQNIRYIPPMPLKPLQDLDIADGSAANYGVKAVTVSVGPGLPFVHILKVPVGLDGIGRRPVFRLIIANGVHRIFRLAELGNTHVAALVQTMDWQELPPTFIETPRDLLLGPGALKVTDMVNGAITRTFRWKKSKRVIKLQVKVLQDVSFVT